MLLPEGLGLDKLSRLSLFKGEISTAAIARAQLYCVATCDFPKLLRLHSATCCIAVPHVAKLLESGGAAGWVAYRPALRSTCWSRSAGFVAKKATPFEEEELVKQVTASKPGLIHVQRS